MFGRKTFEMMAEYWTSQHAFENERVTAESMTELRLQDGKDIAVLGSSLLGKEMIDAGVVDEVRIMLNPVFIGKGSTVFDGLRKCLRLVSSRAFGNSNVLLTYAPA